MLDELGNEKVDIVRWSADPIVYISNALSPAQICKVILTEQGPKFSAHGDEKRDENGDQEAGNEGENEAPRDNALGTATVIVSEDQQSLAIGKQGQNVRLAARLTGWRIDIRTEKQYAEEQAKRMFELDMTPRRVVAERVTQSDEFADILSLDAPEESAGEAGQSAEAEALAAEVGTGENTTEALFSDSAEAAIVEDEASIAEVQSEVSETGDDTPASGEDAKSEL